MIPNKKTYININNEVKEYTYNQKKYNDKYYKKHCETLKSKIKCICGTMIPGRTNILNHNKTKKHQQYINDLEFKIIQNIEKNDDIFIKSNGNDSSFNSNISTNDYDSDKTIKY